MLTALPQMDLDLKCYQSQSSGSPEHLALRTSHRAPGNLTFSEFWIGVGKSSDVGRIKRSSGKIHVEVHALTYKPAILNT